MRIARVSSLLRGTNELPTMPIPEDLRARPIALMENARTVLQKRYLRRGEDGKPAETEQEMFWRVAYHVALAEDEFGEEVEPVARAYYELLTNLQFFPNSPTFTGAGTPLGQLAACFVMAIDDDMGRTESGIFQTLRDAALIQQTGGGNGFAFSRLRPKGAIVNSSRGEATGPVGFLRVYDQAFGEIAQGGSRRGANMAVLKVSHPDIREFVTCKTDESHITNFNISVGITDEFMRAVENDSTFDLINPQNGEVWETARARDLFDLIVKQAHHNGEPGVLFLDAANRANPVPHLYELESTNPCFIGSTRIATDRGLLTIQELAESTASFMVGTDGRAPFGGIGLPATSTYGVAFRQSSPAWKTRQNTPVMKLVTKHGYSVTATPDHKFLTPDRGYIELRRLQVGDRLLLQSGEGAWSKEYQLPNVEVMKELVAVMGKGGDHPSGPTVTRRDFAVLHAPLPSTWSHDLGMVIGWLVGDGWLSPDSGSPLGMVFGRDSQETRDIIHNAMREWFGEGHLHERASVWQLTYGQLPYQFFRSLGVLPVRAPQKRVPDSLWTAPREAVIGFLQGLFTADGTVNYAPEKKSSSIRLASSSRALLEDVQLMLLNFGIVSKLRQRRKAGYRMMPDGRGGHKAYLAHTDYELLIDKANRVLFIERIGFVESTKQRKAQAFIDAKARRSHREMFVTTVAGLHDAGTADVYDLTEPQTSSLITNGIVAHNCGEQFLGPFENCCLGSINLAKLNIKGGRPDWDQLQRITEVSTRFLDDVVSANSYVPSVPQLAEAAHRVRRIGLGIMGLADLMYQLGVRYGSEEGQEFAGQIMEFVRYHCMKTSIELAKERGAFPAIKGSIYDPDDFKWQPPTPLFAYKRDWGRPALDWARVVKGIKKHGIRNGATTTVAPTGTIATVSGCEGYGCEPVFALAYIRHVNDKGRDLQLQYTSPLFERALREAGLSEAEINNVIQQVNLTGSCQNVSAVPEHIRHTFVVSADITAEEHIYMQAAMQRFVDNAISKCVTGDTLVLSPEGLTPIEEFSEMRLPDQFQSLEMEVMTPTGIEKTNAFFYGGMRETRRIKLSYGYQIEGTPNHRIHVLDTDGTIRFKTLDELKIGDTAVLYSGQMMFGPGGQALPGYEGEFLTNSGKPTLPKIMSPELAYVLGCLTSKGHFSPNGVGITNGDRKLLERLSELIKQLFDLPAAIVKDVRRDNVYTLRVNSRHLRNWLLHSLNMQAGARSKLIPTCILRASRQEIAAFLRGLFLDSFMTRDGRMFGIGLAARPLLRQLQTLLLNFGVLSRIAKAGPHAWALTVAGASLEKLAAFVEFDEVWKAEPIAIRHEGGKQRLHNYAEMMPRALTESPRRMQDVSDPFADAFFKADQAQCIYVAVKAIESNFAEVFDLSVPGSHTFIANGLGNHNTCNFPETATVEDVAKAYLLGWKLGCKGLTVYVTGSRDKVVLETHATAQSKNEGKTAESALAVAAESSAQAPSNGRGGKFEEMEQLPIFNEAKKPRPRRLEGRTYRVGTPLGATYVTINENGHGKGQPFELFVHTSKAGSETAAISEAIGRLSSLILRMASPIPPRERVQEIIHQLEGIGGERSIGFGAQRVRSLPDGIAQVLQEYLEETAGGEEDGPRFERLDELDRPTAPKQLALKIGDLCPECGEASVVNEEGCRKCRNCGYSEC